MNARFEQFARDFAVRFGRYGDAHRIDTTDQFAPVSGPICFSFPTDLAGRFFVQIANGGKLRETFRCERGVNASVLAAETADSDDCCA